MFNVLKSGRYFSSLCMQSRGLILIQMKCHLPCFLTGILQISGIILHPKCTPTSVFQHSACVADLFPIQTHVNFQPVLFNSVCTSLCFEEALKIPTFRCKCRASPKIVSIWRIFEPIRSRDQGRNHYDKQIM